MIHPSARWRFIKELDDRPYFEDEIVLHHLTHHRARRRSFNEKFSADTAAVEAVRAQMRAAAGCNPPALPRIYHLEMVQGRLSVVMEHIEGRPLTALVEGGKLCSVRAWTRFAIHFLREIMEIRRAGGRCEFLDQDQVVLTESGDWRLTGRHPTGLLTRAQRESSPILDRFAEGMVDGVYTSTNLPHEAGELAALRRILLTAACGSPRRTFDELRGEVLKNPGMYSSPLEMVEPEIGRILVEMQVEAGGEGRIRTVDELMRAVTGVQEQRDVSVTAIVLPSGNSPAAHHTPLPEEPFPSPRTPTPVPPSGTGYPAIPTPPRDRQTPPASPPSPGRRSSGSVPKFLPPIAGGSRRDPKSGSVLDDDALLNPYAAGPALDTPEKALKPVRPRDPASSARTRHFVLLSVAGLVVLAGLAGAAMMFMSPPPNEPPLAAIRAPRTLDPRVDEPLVLDAGSSVDPEGTALSYRWRLAAPEDGEVIFAEVGQDRAQTGRTFATLEREIEVQFLRPGVAVLELVVTDEGQASSEPSRLTFNVLARR